MLLHPWGFPGKNAGVGCHFLCSSIHGVFQAIMLEWVAISLSRGSSQSRDRIHVSFTGRILYQKSLTDNRRQQNSQRSDHSTVCAVFLGYPQGIGSRTLLLLLLLLSRFSRVRLCATPYVAAHQAPLSLGFPRQEHWSGLPFPSPMHESEKRKDKHIMSY